MKTAPQFPTIEEQTEYWNKKEGEELERVSRLQEAESRTATNETRSDCHHSPVIKRVSGAGDHWLQCSSCNKPTLFKITNNNA